MILLFLNLAGMIGIFTFLALGHVSELPDPQKSYIACAVLFAGFYGMVSGYQIRKRHEVQEQFEKLKEEALWLSKKK